MNLHTFLNNCKPTIQQPLTQMHTQGANYYQDMLGVGNLYLVPYRAIQPVKMDVVGTNECI